MDCTIENCDKESYQRDMCSMHYMQWYRRRRRGNCSVEQCNRAVYSKGYCESHYKKQLRDINPEYDEAQKRLADDSHIRIRKARAEERVISNPHGFKKDVVSYSGAHHRVKRLRGNISSHFCVDCGRTAEQWSLNNESEDIIFGPGSMGEGNYAYSLNIFDYDARCIPCHSIYDKEHRVKMAPS